MQKYCTNIVAHKGLFLEETLLLHTVQYYPLRMTGLRSGDLADHASLWIYSCTNYRAFWAFCVMQNISFSFFICAKLVHAQKERIINIALKKKTIDKLLHLYLHFFPQQCWMDGNVFLRLTDQALLRITVHTSSKSTDSH